MIDVTFANYFCYSLESFMSYKNPPGERHLVYAEHKLGLPKLKTKFLMKLLCKRSLEKNSL